MNFINQAHVHKRIGWRIFKSNLFKLLFFIATLFSLIVLTILIYRIFEQGFHRIDIHFLTNKLSTFPDKAGIMGAILGTLWLMVIVAPLTMFIGVCTAIHLELYVKKGRFKTFVQANIANLAGVPSIVYGILGLTIFARGLQLGNIILAGGLTLSLLVLPIIIVASQEAIRSVSYELSEASYGLGATKWQTVKNIIIPKAMPGILTGTILSLSRAIGETAPLVALGIPALIIPLPGGIMDSFTVLPIQIYYWTLDSSLNADYANLAAATIIVLLVTLFANNTTTIILRNKFKKRN